RVSKLLKIWRAWGDSNARPLVPEFSGNWLSCWFALLSAPRCYLVFLAVGCLVFRNCSEAGALFFGSSGLCVNPVWHLNGTDQMPGTARPVDRPQGSARKKTVSDCLCQSGSSRNVSRTLRPGVTRCRGE